jgi:predicted  nucleic acid-binding Zn-ribbon protein
MDAQTLISLCTTIVGLGIFIGISKSTQANLKETLNRMEGRLQRIEEKQDKQNEEMADLRERVAVIESTLEIRKNK